MMVFSISWSLNLYFIGVGCSADVSSLSNSIVTVSLVDVTGDNT